MPERGIGFFAWRLVLPGKGATPKDIGITGAAADDGIFFFKQIAVFTAGLGNAEQLAQIKKVALRALLLVKKKGQPAGAPFGDEGLGRHVFLQ
ncbi:MAG: hypothetical protein V4646_10950 [Pseudomonadota bacterium]